MIRVTCPYCRSSGYISPPPRRTILMGPCPVCGEAVALYNNKVIGLKRRMQGDGTFGEKIQSLARIIMEYINSQGGVMEESDLEQIIHDSEGRIDAGSHQSESEQPCHMSPSIKNPVSTPISAEEARDFLRIDLNLLSKREYFDKFFS